jgi:periplasmic protein TonB
MTLTTKDSTDPASPSKPTAPAQNPENKSAQTSRSNPVCLEVAVTIRSLPTESGGAFQPIREEGRTVIVFDNGAVLRCASNLPIGQTVILSNPSGRDVICRIAGARNMPSIKGYVEVEFIEPVEDFWHIHGSIEPSVASRPPVPASVALASPAAAGPETPARTAPEKPAAGPTGSGPSFEDVAGLVSPPGRPVSREPRAEPAKPARDLRTKNEPTRASAETNGSSQPSAAKLSGSELRHAKPEIDAADESESVMSRDSMEEGLLASTQAASSSSSGLAGGMPLRIGGAALLLACIGGGMYFMQRGSAPAPATQVAGSTQPSVPGPSVSAGSTEPGPALASQAAVKREVPQAGQTQPAVIAHAESAASIAATPVAVSSPTTRDLVGAQRQDKSTQDKTANTAQTSDVAPSRSPAIPNLKMKSPSAPKRNLATQSDAAAPVADIVTPESSPGTSSAGLLPAVARSANQPAPPPVTPAELAATNHEAKLISSAPAVYPQAAKVANIQGTVAVLASIDSKGNVVDAKAESGPMLLRQAALESVRRWRYSPALADGKPVATKVVVSVEFKLH